MLVVIKKKHINLEVDKHFMSLISNISHTNTHTHTHQTFIGHPYSIMEQITLQTLMNGDAIAHVITNMGSIPFGQFPFHIKFIHSNSKFINSNSAF